MFLLNGVLGWSGQEAARIPAVLKGLGGSKMGDNFRYPKIVCFIMRKRIQLDDLVVPLF